MGIPGSTMLKSTPFSVFILAFVAFFKGDECEKIEDNSCAIVYDDEDCGEGDWDPLRLKSSSTPVSFSTLTLNPLKAFKNAKYKDDIESLVVRQGCKLEAWRKSDCTGAKATFDARDKTQDLIIEELEDSDYDDFDEAIECMICRCN